MSANIFYNVVFLYHENNNVEFTGHSGCGCTGSNNVFICKFFEEGKLSLGQAVNVAGYSKRTFMELLGKYNVSLFNYDAHEIANDVNNAHTYSL